MVWNLEVASNGSQGSGEKKEFTKFAEGVTFIQILDNGPHVRWAHWLPLQRRSVTCPGRGCSICEIRNRQKANKEKQTYGMTKRFAINVYNHDTKKVEIMEQGKTFFEDLRDLVEDAVNDGKNPLEVVFKVRRRGTGQDDTSYRIDIDSSKEAVKIESEITDLNEYFKPITLEQSLALAQGKAFDEAMNIGNEQPQEAEKPQPKKEEADFGAEEIELE